ncbi:MAG: hypothetical protein E6Z15_20145, partial [Paenibacillus macerans]|nr:hypothetical protein [Paenibacillus macerans]
APELLKIRSRRTFGLVSRHFRNAFLNRSHVILLVFSYITENTLESILSFRPEYIKPLILG